MRGVLCLAAAALLVAGCAGSKATAATSPTLTPLPPTSDATSVSLPTATAEAAASPWPARTPFPLPSGATAVPLTTAAPASPYPSGVAWACPAMLILPVRISWDPESKAVSFISVSTGKPISLVWPRGFSARLLGGRLEVLAPDGSIVGRDGDQVSSLGGTTDGICNVSGTFYPPAS